MSMLLNFVSIPMKQIFIPNTTVNAVLPVPAGKYFTAGSTVKKCIRNLQRLPSVFIPASKSFLDAAGNVDKFKKAFSRRRSG